MPILTFSCPAVTMRTSALTCIRSKVSAFVPLGQGCASFARDRDRWPHNRPSGPWRIASPICADL